MELIGERVLDSCEEVTEKIVSRIFDCIQMTRLLEKFEKINQTLPNFQIGLEGSVYANFWQRESCHLSRHLLDSRHVYFNAAFLSY